MAEHSKWANMDEAAWAELDQEWLAGGPTNDLERPWYRMPVGFGRAPGPRNIPVSKRGGYVANSRSTWASVTALTERAPLEVLLPPGIELRGDPAISVGFHLNQNAFLNAGLTYTACGVSTQVTSYREGEPVDGNYTLVEWHSRPDNMMTAREEIAYASLWAEIDLIPRGARTYTGQAVWNGFRFLEFRLDDLEDAVAEESRQHTVSILYKYIPKGYGEGADVARVVHNDMTKYYAPGGTADAAVQEEVTTEPPKNRVGRGMFRFNAAEWEDMPTQFHVVNTLSALPLLDFTAARLSSLPGIRTAPPASE
jgi:Acetoacetate decarboxylase (ADC)